MENAFKASGIAPAEVDYVNAHATSTLIGDVSEARALRAVFGEMGVRPAISSTKALTGHGLSLAGAMQMGRFCALSMREGFIPGSAHITRLDPACEGLNILLSDKKATFLREVARTLTLTNVDIQNVRAETLPPSSYDIVTLRAVEHFETAPPPPAS